MGERQIVFSKLANPRVGFPAEQLETLCLWAHTWSLSRSFLHFPERDTSPQNQACSELHRIPKMLLSYQCLLSCRPSRLSRSAFCKLSSTEHFLK